MDYGDPTRLLCPWGFSRQEYWSGLPFPSLGEIPDPGIKPRSPALASRLYHLSHQGSKIIIIIILLPQDSIISISEISQRNI